MMMLVFEVEGERKKGRLKRTCKRQVEHGIFLLLFSVGDWMNGIRLYLF